MNSILLCEGSTDFVLLQYFMRNVYNWEDKEIGPKFLQPTRILTKDGRKLVIGGTGGSSQIIPKLNKIIEGNHLSSLETEYYNKIVIVTDRDDADTESDLIKKVNNIFSEFQVKNNQSVMTNKWISCEMLNSRKEHLTLELLILVIPFEETGALETFLLQAIAKQDGYDDKIIKQSSIFVDEIDPEKRYLTSRRYITKAKFDVYFSIRTPAAFFAERQNILRGIDWCQYIEINNCFSELEKI